MLSLGGSEPESFANTRQVWTSAQSQVGQQTEREPDRRQPVVLSRFEETQQFYPGHRARLLPFSAPLSLKYLFKGKKSKKNESTH
jgi:hypothetical protein